MKIKATEKECMDALIAVRDDPHAPSEFVLIESLIKDYFRMFDHMKATSLYDVYTYEREVAKALFDPMEMYAFDNARLKKEVNQLRRKLNMVEKYKIIGEEE